MDNLKEKLGARIQEIRKAQNLTQEKLAEMIDMDTANLSNIERGKRFMTAETLEKIANALSVSPKTLFEFEHEKPTQKLITEIINSLEQLSEKEICYIYKTIDNIKLLRK